MIFKFLWNGTDKVTRLSTINEYENGGLKMIDLESMIKSLRLAWLKRIFQCNNGAWRSFLRFSLEKWRVKDLSPPPPALPSPALASSKGKQFFKTYFSSHPAAKEC